MFGRPKPIARPVVSAAAVTTHGKNCCVRAVPPRPVAPRPNNPVKR